MTCSIILHGCMLWLSCHILVACTVQKCDKLKCSRGRLVWKSKKDAFFYKPCTRLDPQCHKIHDLGAINLSKECFHSLLFHHRRLGHHYDKLDYVNKLPVSSTRGPWEMHVSFDWEHSHLGYDFGSHRIQGILQKYQQDACVLGMNVKTGAADRWVSTIIISGRYCKYLYEMPILTPGFVEIPFPLKCLARWTYFLVVQCMEYFKKTVINRLKGDKTLQNLTFFLTYVSNPDRCWRGENMAELTKLKLELAAKTKEIGDLKEKIKVKVK